VRVGVHVHPATRARVIFVVVGWNTISASGASINELRRSRPVATGIGYCWASSDELMSGERNTLRRLEFFHSLANRLSSIASRHAEVECTSLAVRAI
jgi:hypothetical protein